LHYNYDNIDQYLEKAVRYAKSEAQLRDNYSLTHALKDARSEFISRLFSSEGFKDGMHGLVLAILQMFYYFLVYFYYWEKKKYSTMEKNTILDFRSFAQKLLFESNFWLIKKNLVMAAAKLKLKVQNKILNLFN